MTGPNELHAASAGGPQPGAVTFFQTAANSLRDRFRLRSAFAGKVWLPSATADAGPCGGRQRFTSEWLYTAAAIALVLRIVAALWSTRIGHPDEIFQYLEQAHRLVYGYGYVPWEYRFGIRNWELPLSLAAILELLRFLRLDTPSVYIPAMNSAAAILSVSVVFSNYSIGRNLFGENTGRASAILAAFWYELLHESTTATPEVFATYAVMGAFAFATGRRRNRPVLTGLLLGAAVSLRPQYAFAAAAVGAYAAFAWGRGSLSRMGLAFLVFPVIAGALDYVFWGTPFISYYNYVLFNGVYNIGNEFDPARIFEFVPWLGYLVPLTILSFGLQPLALLYGGINWRRCWPVLLLIGCVLLPHSLIAHKEYRFIFLMVPLFLILMADMVARWFLPTRWIAIPIGVGCALFVLTSGYVFARDDHLLAVLDLSKREDVRAVIDLTGSWSKSGGFYYLHRDVPLYFAKDLSGKPVNDYRRLASHIIVGGAHPAFPGFRIIARYHDVAVFGQISPPTGYQAAPPKLREPRQKGVDGRIVPQVRRLL